jgi:hypothetical protein
MFDLAIDSKLRGCGVVKLRIGHVLVGGQIRQASMVIKQKTGTPVSFSKSARLLVRAYVSGYPTAAAALRSGSSLLSAALCRA